MTNDHLIQTDASGAWGCEAFWQGHWLQWCWPLEWVTHNIMVMELVPIDLRCAIWGRKLAGSKVLYNSSVVAAVNRHYTKEQTAMHLLKKHAFGFLLPILILISSVST